MRVRLGEKAAGSQCRTDTVAGDVADQEIQVLVIEWTNHSKVATNSASRLRKRINTYATPHNGLWLEVPLTRELRLPDHLPIACKAPAIEYAGQPQTG